ncbi:AAA family ATPase, partial [Acidiphilium sp.]
MSAHASGCPVWDEPPIEAYDTADAGGDNVPLSPLVDPLDQPIAVTFFQNKFASTKTEATISLRDLVDRVRDTTAKVKDDLPWLKLARFGDRRSDKNSLRHDPNVLAIAGIEADYDGEQIAVDDAIESLAMRGIAAMVYTSPRHTPDTPRWRVLCPCSRELPPDQRARLLTRLNGVLGGVLSDESFTLSQSYYFGSVNRSPSHEVHLVEGQYIDLLDDLDAGAIGKPVKSTPPPASTSPSAPKDKISDRRMGAYIDSLLANVRNAVDGDKHFAVLRNATALGGVQSQAGFSDAEAIEWIIKALRDGGRDVKDWNAAAKTAEDGLAAGRKTPIDLGPDRERPAPQAAQDAYQADDQGTQAKQAEPPAPGAQPDAPRTLRPINPADLEYTTVPDREWLIPDWLGVGYVTGQYGDGGVGKGMTAQALQTSTATGTAWLGYVVKPCRSIGLYCEDDNDELHRRQDRICKANGVSFRDLEPMRWISGVGHDNTFCTFTPDGKMQVTDRYYEVAKIAENHDAKLIILDNVADLFGGNENDRNQVRRFINLLNRLALDRGAAILLNCHPSRAGLASGSLDGGSTAWSNSMRSRWTLAKAAVDDDGTDNGERVLSRAKANYAPDGGTIKLRWAGGVLVPVNREGGLAASFARVAVERVFLDLLDRCDAQNVFVSESRNAANYAPKFFGRRPDREGYNRAYPVKSDTHYMWGGPMLPNKAGH